MEFTAASGNCLRRAEKKNIVKIHSHLKFSYIYIFLIKLGKITIFNLLIVFRRVRKIAKSDC